MALLPRARPDEPRRKMRARDHHGQALLQRAGSASDVRLHANYGRLRLHERIPDLTPMARRPVERHRRRALGNHEIDHRERRETMRRGSGEWGVGSGADSGHINSHSPFPTPHSPFSNYSYTTPRSEERSKAKGRAIYAPIR